MHRIFSTIWQMANKPSSATVRSILWGPGASIFTRSSFWVTCLQPIEWLNRKDITPAHVHSSRIAAAQIRGHKCTQSCARTAHCKLRQVVAFRQGNKYNVCQKVFKMWLYYQFKHGNEESTSYSRVILNLSFYFKL